MRITTKVQRVIKEAAEEARKRGDRDWGREHVLLSVLGLGGQAGGRAAQILERLGIHERRVREVIDRHRPPGPELEEPPPVLGEPPTQVTFAGKQTERLWVHTRWVAAYLGQRTADTEHLLLGLLSDDRPGDSIDKIFAELGLRFEEVYRELTGEPPPQELRPPRPVIIPIADCETALRMLPKVLPVDVSYSFNFDDERAWFESPSDIDLEDYMKRALAQAGDGSNGHRAHA